MNIVTRRDPKPIPMRDADWSAIDSDTYDGAPDSRTRHQIGYGATESEAINDLFQILTGDLDDFRSPDCVYCGGARVMPNGIECERCGGTGRAKQGD